MIPNTSGYGYMSPNYVPKKNFESLNVINKRNLNLFDLVYPPNSDRCETLFESIAILGFRVKSIAWNIYNPITGDPLPYWGLNSKFVSLCSSTLAGGNGQIASLVNSENFPIIATWPNKYLQAQPEAVVDSFSDQDYQPEFIFPHPLITSKIDFYLLVDGIVFTPGPTEKLTVCIEFIY